MQNDLKKTIGTATKWSAMAFDLFDIKHCDDETLSWAFWLCVIIICLQIALYCLIRTNNSESGKVKSIIASICMMGASGITCGFSIKAIFQHSITEDGGEETRDSENM